MMAEQVILSSVIANLPVDVYYCDSTGSSCVFVDTVSVFPYSFVVPSPYSDNNFTIKLIDDQSCERIETFYMTPTPTLTPYASKTPTNSITPTKTPTVSVTKTKTPTKTPTLTPTQTHTQTLSKTPFKTPKPTI